MSIPSTLFHRAALGAFVAAAVSACAPTAPARAPASAATPAATPAPAPTVVAAAAATPPAAWPAAARSLTADDLRGRISGQVFDLPLDKGISVRMDFRDNGYVFINVHPNGVSDTGRWRVDGSQVCSEMRRFPSGCNEWRTVGDRMMLRRTNGQLVTLGMR